MNYRNDRLTTYINIVYGLTIFITHMLLNTTYIPIIVPVATPHNIDSRTHHLNDESSIDCRTPNASGNILVHASDEVDTVAFTFALVLPLSPLNVLSGMDNCGCCDDDDRSTPSPSTTPAPCCAEVASEDALISDDNDKSFATDEIFGSSTAGVGFRDQNGILGR